MAIRSRLLVGRLRRASGSGSRGRRRSQLPPPDALLETRLDPSPQGVPIARRARLRSRRGLVRRPRRTPPHGLAPVVRGSRGALWAGVSRRLRWGSRARPSPIEGALDSLPDRGFRIRGSSGLPGLGPGLGWEISGAGRMVRARRRLRRRSGRVGLVHRQDETRGAAAKRVTLVGHYIRAISAPRATGGDSAAPPVRPPSPSNP